MTILAWFDGTIELALANMEASQRRVEASLKALHSKVDKLQPTPPPPPADLTKLWQDINHLRALDRSIPTIEG